MKIPPRIGIVLGIAGWLGLFAYPAMALAQDAADVATQEQVAAPSSVADSGTSASPEASAPELAAEPTPAVPETVDTVPVASTETPEPVPPPDPEDTPDGMTRIDEIVVTAQKRAERLQDVPVAITVIKQEDMERANVTQISDLSRLAPSVEVNGQPGNADTRISIRGISTESFSVTAEQAVSIVVDGVVLGKTPSVSLFDIGRVEILRGPQGTLFGKNSSAGAISISTNPPDPSRFMAGARIDTSSSFGYRLLQGSLNLPLTENSALRLNAGQTLTDGFIHNNVRNEDSTQQIDGMRMRFLWNATPDLTINLIADYEKQRTTEQLYLQFDRYTDNNGEPQPIPGCNGAFGGPDNRISCAGDPIFNNGQSWGFSGQLELAIGDYTLTSISALRRYTQYNEIDVDGLPGNYYNNSNTFNNEAITQEFRIASPGGERLKYVAGLYYSHTYVPNFLTQVIGTDILASVATGPLDVSLCTQFGICTGALAGLNQPNEYIATIISSAAFGQLTYELTDRLSWILGGRATHDDVSMVSTNFVGVASSAPFLQNLSPLTPLNAPLSGESVVDNISWRTGLQYQLADDIMAFLTFSKGYKGPQVVFNPPGLIPSIGPPPVLPTPASISIVRPEYPNDAQLGLKATLFEGLFAANINLFHTRINDFQGSVFNGQAKFTPNNIPSVVTKGVEIDLFGYLYPGLTLNSGLLYNEVTYPSTYLVGCTQVGPKCPDTDEGTVHDVGGKQLPIAPKIKVTFSPEYSFDLFSGIRGFVGSDITYRSKIHYGAADDTRTQAPGRTVVGGRIGVRGPGDNWEISVFGRNLTDAYNPAFLFAPYLLTSASTPQRITAGHALSTESFRFIGVSAGARF